MNVKNSFIFSRLLILILGVIHILIALMFFFRPNEFFYLINVGPKVFRAFIEIPNANEKFWIAFASQYYILCGLLLLLAGYQNKIKSILILLVFSKLICCLSLFHLFNVHEKYFAYVAGGLSEGLFMLVILITTFRLSKT